MPVENVPQLEAQRRRVWVGVGCALSAITAFFSHQVLKAAGVTIDHWAMKFLIAFGVGFVTYLLVMAAHGLTKKRG